MRRPPHPLMRVFRDLRLDRGLSQLEVAGAIGVAQSAVGGWENGFKWPTLRHLAALADFFGYELTVTPKERP